ncbi:MULTISPECIES: hypothetical protein [Niastella]|uniref:S-adenosyl-methyltransferase n=1 Tax=Niastella soli TaxID=2821487 RepID=A0ABS3YP69_9BACT|nr:hypothetical protein [Niastella soli]MBO9199270.1 hypothetical protein [Niastella soli]
MKGNHFVFIFRILAAGAIVLIAFAFVLQQKNRQLTEFNNKLLLQNDSVLSVNLQLQKDINFLKHDLDSLVHNYPEKQPLTSSKLVSVK